MFRFGMSMKKLLAILAIGMLILSSCSNASEKEDSGEEKRTRFFSPFELLK
jgi:PBP1b-binding outer membrane lipoprotein LpoB